MAAGWDGSDEAWLEQYSTALVVVGAVRCTGDNSYGSNLTSAAARATLFVPPGDDPSGGAVVPLHRPPRVSRYAPDIPHAPTLCAPQVMIPVVEHWCRYTGHPVSRFMMPLSYAAILGGLCTVIGTSTNLIARGLAQADIPTLRIPFFEVGACRAACNRSAQGGTWYLCARHVAVPAM